MPLAMRVLFLRPNVLMLLRALLPLLAQMQL
jgi:hypothetical protein